MSRDLATFVFHEPYPFTAVSDQNDAACAECSDEFKYPSNQLTAIKVHRPRRPEGHWLIFCAEHLAEYQSTDHPEDEAAAASAPRTRAKKASVPKVQVPVEPKLASKVEREGVMCPDCFVEASLTGACPMCGEPIAA